MSRGRRFEASGDKKSFLRVMDFTSQTSLVDCFHNFTVVFPTSMQFGFSNLSHLKCTIMGDGMKTRKNRNRRKHLSGVPQSPDCLFNLQPSSTNLVFSGSEPDSAMLPSHLNGKTLALRECFCSSRMDFIHMCQDLYRFFHWLPLHASKLGHFSDTLAQCFQWGAPVLMTVASEGKRVITVNNTILGHIRFPGI